MLSEVLYAFPKRQILHFSNLKEFVDDNFKFNENGQFANGLKTQWEKEKLLVTKDFLLKSIQSHALTSAKIYPKVVMLQCHVKRDCTVHIKTK